jgi:hypothetical protein
MPDYDATRFDPPAPVAEVSVRNVADATKMSDLHLLLDSGADVTLLPRTAVTSIGVQPISNLRYELVAFDGSKSFAEVADLAVVFLNCSFKGRYVLIDSDNGVMGRDILNHVSLLLDGPKESWLGTPPSRDRLEA